MEFTIRLPRGDRVEVHTGEHVVVTEQDGSNPSPLTLFLASIGACAGYYVARFCQQRGISTEGVVLRQTHAHDAASHRVTEVVLALELPGDFPPNYRDAVVRAAQTCTVKRLLEQPPRVSMEVLVPR